MTKASIIMFDNTSAKAGQFQPVIEMSVFPASPAQART